MYLAARVLVYFVYYLLQAVMLAMLGRAILSWFPAGEESRFVRFLDMVTEPFVYPIRRLFYHYNWFQQTPLDVSFLVSYLVLALVSFLFGTLI